MEGTFAILQLLGNNPLLKIKYICNLRCEVTK